MRYEYNNNYFNDTYQGIPIGGYTKWIENMLKGIEVRLNCDYLEHKEELNKLADKIIYTGEIDKYFDYKYGALEWRSFYTRIAEHQYFEPGQKHNKTVITKEYSKTWTLGEEAYYPINNDRNSVLYSKYQELAKENPNVYFGGRLGTYSYYNMDVVVEKALQLVESLID